jgi:polyhydroxyalkanoate synthesis regulator protein
MEWFENALRMFAPFATGMAPKGGPGAGKPPRKDVELDELKEQLASMQAQLAKLTKEQ